MKCQQFEEILIDLASNRVEVEMLREEAMTHSRSCVRCAFRLEEESVLSALLQKPDPCAAPAHLEDNLLRAYRRQFRNDPGGLPPRGRRSEDLLVLAASFLLVFLGATSYLLLHTLEPGLSPQTNSDRDSLTSLPGENGMVGQKAEGGSPPSVTRGAFYSSIKLGRTGVEGDSIPTEITSDFIPLTSGVETAMMEGGQIVRVLLPRAAMAYYGLPTNQERLDIPVHAQVLISHDGVARAIRFISELHYERIQPEPY